MRKTASRRSSIRVRSSEPLLTRVWEELGQGRITERYIPDDDWIVHGELDRGRITINPAHVVVEIVIHELLHRLHPEWPENYVRRTTRMLRNQMTDVDVQAFYQAYNRQVRGGKTRQRRR